MATGLGLTSLILAGLVAGAAPGDEPPAAQPVRLDVVDSGDHLLLKVVGASDVAVEAGFRLDVTSQGSGGTNRTSQSGHARLQPGQEVTMMTLSVANGPASRWQAVLNVDRAGGGSYTVQRSSGG